MLRYVPGNAEKSVDELVQEVRSLYRSKIQYDCDKIQFLNRQVSIGDLYTKVYILEDIPKLRSLDISERMQGFDPTADDPNSFYLGKVRGERIPGLDLVTDGCKLMCLGAPGSGKTTYLSYVAIQCNEEKLQANRVPIFIRLFSFAEKVAEKLTEQLQWSLFDYIEDLLGIQGIQQVDVKSILLEGRGLILLDGLDEVPKNIEKLNIFYELPKNFDLSKLILRRIREFCETYHKNSIIITCRTNALDYNFSNLGFTQVIVSDFEDKQIKIFAENWFVAAAKNTNQAGKAKAKQFIEKLNSSKNKRIRDLAVTPILLNLTCLVFNKNDDFPSNRSELYRQALDILLKEWDTSREIPRDEVYGNLDLESKKALLIHVAKVTFDENRYFFKQEEIEKYIADYLQTLPNAQTDSLQRDSRAVLKSIEVQHGLLIERAPKIYSFSHLTFQEYFTAKWFCDRADWHGLVSHIKEKHWREVFLLAVGMSKNIDELLRLMKHQVDAIASNKEIRQFLTWIDNKCISIESPYKPAALRAFCYALEMEYIYYIDFAFEITHQNLNFDWSDFISVNKVLYKNDLPSKYALSISIDHNIGQELETSLHSTFGSSSARKLQSLIEQLKNSHNYLEQPVASSNDFTVIKAKIEWWKTKGQAWLEKLRTVMIDYHSSGSQWQFSQEQQELLKQYYNANKLLVDCLNSNCGVNDEVRNKIEETLLLPFDVIENSQQQM